MDDTQLTALLHDAVRDVEAPTTHLVAHGLARGRRRLRRRRAVEVGSASVLVAAVAALTVALVPSGSDHRTTDALTTPTGVRPTPPSSSRAVPTAEGDTVQMTPQALLQTALDRLPGSGTTSEYHGRTLLGFVGAEFGYDDGHGAAELSVSLQYDLPGGGVMDQLCAQFDCDTLPDGGRRWVSTGWEYPGQADQGARLWSVTVERPGGFVVEIDEANSTHGKDSPITRPLPPFTTDQLTAVLDSGAFALHITKARAAAAAGLFVPDPDPDAGAPAAPSVAASCARAAKLGTPRPQGCSR